MLKNWTQLETKPGSDELTEESKQRHESRLVQFMEDAVAKALKGSENNKHTVFKRLVVSDQNQSEKKHLHWWGRRLFGVVLGLLEDSTLS